MVRRHEAATGIGVGQPLFRRTAKSLRTRQVSGDESISHYYYVLSYTHYARIIMQYRCRRNFFDMCVNEIVFFFIFGTYPSHRHVLQRRRRIAKNVSFRHHHHYFL